MEQPARSKAAWTGITEWLTILAWTYPYTLPLLPLNSPISWVLSYVPFYFLLRTHPGVQFSHSSLVQPIFTYCTAHCLGGRHQQLQLWGPQFSFAFPLSICQQHFPSLQHSTWGMQPWAPFLYSFLKVAGRALCLLDEEIKNIKAGRTKRGKQRDKEGNRHGKKIKRISKIQTSASKTSSFNLSSKYSVHDTL